MPRNVNIVTVCFNEERRYGASMESNLNKAIEMLDAVSAIGVDLVCLPEVFLGTGVPSCKATDDMAEFAFDALSKKAKALNSYIIAGMHERIGLERFNVAWLIDREGKFAGRYVKHHPTIGEITDGIVPGKEIPVFQTDFGKVGITICYDIGWPNLWDVLGSKGAEIVVWISAYDGGFPLQVYAWTNFYYVVSSVRTNHSRIIDKTGRILASTSRWMGWTCKRVNLEKEIFHIDQQFHKLPEIQRKVGGGLIVESFSEENIFTLESQDPDWPIERIIKEFDLETYRDYHKRAEVIQDKARR